MKEVYCAIDLGATSGRVIVSDGGDLQEVYRFPNGIYERDGMFFWDTDALWREIQQGLRLLAGRDDLRIRSIGVDSWGCDVVFVGNDGNALAHPRAYRDPYTDGMMESLWKQLGADGRRTVYRKTGIQMLPFNTIYQFYACRMRQYKPFMQAAHYLWIADWFNYLLTGEMRNEYTLLSTSQLLNWYDGDAVRPHLDDDLLEACGAKRECFAPMVRPGERIGLLRKEVSLFAYDIPVIAVASHDTASAVATVEKGHVAYLSSGTWSLMGVVSGQPVITDDSYRLNFTNEGGVGQTSRVLKNITGMWILEQCRREWKEQGKDYSHERLIQMAQQYERELARLSHPILVPVFNPDDPQFTNPPSMLAEIKKAIGCRSNCQCRDEEIVWAVCHSLASRYRDVFRMLQQLTPWRIEKLCIIGGGARNHYLNRLTEFYLNLFVNEDEKVQVTTGATEATALGNIRIQSLGTRPSLSA